MKIASIIGMAAAILTTISFIPQVIKTIKTRDTRGISLFMYIIFTIGISLWMVYGIITQQWPIIIANAVTVLNSGIVLYFKIRES